MVEMPVLAPESEWVKDVDVEALERDFKALGKKYETQQGEADAKHLKKIMFFANGFQFVGWLLLWMHPVYMLPSVFYALGTFARWTMVGHHVSHGGYNNVFSKQSRFQRFRFAVGSVFNRLRDWPDWMLPEAWDIEHNHYHHYSLNEDDDPDLVERNLDYIRSMDAPTWLKYGIVAFLACTWKWFYYSVNTFVLLKTHMENCTLPGKNFFTLDAFLTGLIPKVVPFSSYFLRVMAPYLAYCFFLLPLPLLLGASFLADYSPEMAGWCSTAYKHAIVNMVVADVLTNVHAFIVITTNHAGMDMYRYKTHCRPLSASFYIRAIVSSANYSAGTDTIDFLHGWLNYQVEHHCFPKLSMLSYQRMMPEVKELAKRHGIPYTQESVWVRLKKTVDSMVGSTTMRQMPLEWEQYLNHDLLVVKK